MKCRVCSQETLGPARLCPTCEVAMKRAREVLTVGSKTVAPSDIPSRSTLLPRRRRDALLIGAGVAVTVTAAVYWDQRDRYDPPATTVAALAQAAVQPPVTPAPGAVPIFEPALREAGLDKDVRAAMPAASPTAKAATAATRPVQSAASQRIAPVPSPSASVGSLKPTTRSGAATQAGERASTRMAETAVPKKAVAQDRWQALATALGRCGTEGFFTRVVCEERARWKYCEGAWGEVSQCPVSRRSDNIP